MAALALALCVLYAVVLFGVRAVVQRHQTGSTGWVAGATPAEHLANAVFVVAWLLDLLGPALVLAGLVSPVPALDGAAAHAGGIAVFGLSLGLGVLAQRTMGSAWRTGIDPGHPTHLVTHDLFAVVRNPVYTTMLAASLAVALLVPTVVSPFALATCLIALEIQTRVVEEPHLRRVHGERYRRYARRVGRFLPGIGRGP